MKTYASLSIVALIVALVGCSDSPAAPSGVTSLQIADLRVGTGAVVALGQTITVNYTLWLYDSSRAGNKGTLVQSTNGSPIPLQLRSGSVIQGWVDGLVGMRVGGIRSLTIPPNLAYGSTPQQGIPANSTLIFEVEMVAAQ